MRRLRAKPWAKYSNTVTKGKSGQQQNKVHTGLWELFLKKEFDKSVLEGEEEDAQGKLASVAE